MLAAEQRWLSTESWRGVLIQFNLLVGCQFSLRIGNLVFSNLLQAWIGKQKAWWMISKILCLSLACDVALFSCLAFSCPTLLRQENVRQENKKIPKAGKFSKLPALS